jgi:putative PIN family toxin of toxin-antitoxin system
MKIVFDSNVYLAAIKRDSYARTQLQRSAPEGPYQIYISPEIILEVRDVLERSFGYGSEDSARFIRTILRYARLVHAGRKVSGVLQDSDDHIILECALEARADGIVTSDKELLKLQEFEGVKIFHPSMLQYLR